MGYEEITDLGTDTVTAIGGVNKKTNKPNPTSIEGYFLGSREVPSAMSKTGFAKIHVFQTPKGNEGVWGKTDLDIKLAGVTPGTMTLVKFDRMQANKGKQPMYKYKVSVDKDNTIEVAGTSVVGNAETVESDETYAGNSSGYQDTDDGADDAAQAAELARLERVARLQALLKKGNHEST